MSAKPITLSNPSATSVSSPPPQTPAESSSSEKAVQLFLTQLVVTHGGDHKYSGRTDETTLQASQRALIEIQEKYRKAIIEDRNFAPMVEKFGQVALTDARIEALMNAKASEDSNSSLYEGRNGVLFAAFKEALRSLQKEETCCLSPLYDCIAATYIGMKRGLNSVPILGPGLLFLITFILYLIAGLMTLCTLGFVLSIVCAIKNRIDQTSAT